MTLDDEPVAVYFGGDMECIFLKSLLEGSDIPAQVESFSFSGAGSGSRDVRVFVARKDAERALPLVEDFKQHGTKSES